MKELWRLTKTEGRMSTVYHPQTDGQTERANKEIETYLRIFCTANPHNWADLVTDMEVAFNNREHSATKLSPFFLMYGLNPRLLPTVLPRSKVPSIEEWLQKHARAQEEANATLDYATATMASRLHCKFKPFEKGQKVWLEMTNFNDGYPYRKLAPKRQGPFKIKEVLSPIVYRLDLRGQRKIHDVFNACLLSPYVETIQHGPNYISQPPEIIDGHEEHEVEAILHHKTSYGRMLYLVT